MAGVEGRDVGVLHMAYDQAEMAVAYSGMQAAAPVNLGEGALGVLSLVDSHLLEAGDIH